MLLKGIGFAFLIECATIWNLVLSIKNKPHPAKAGCGKSS